MNLATAEALRSIYVTAAGERNRVARLLGEIAKIALLGEGEELPEVPELPLARAVRDPGAPSLSSTERSRLRRERLQREREARQEVSFSRPDAFDRSDATAHATDATDATVPATPMQRDATERCVAPLHGASPPGSPLSPSPSSLKTLQKERYGEGGIGGDAPLDATGATADATAGGPPATADATDATPLQRVAVAPSPLHPGGGDLGRNVFEAWQRGIVARTGGQPAVVARREVARVTTAILDAAHSESLGGDLRGYAYALGQDFARQAQAASMRINHLTFGDWLLAGRSFPERGSGVHKTRPMLQPPGRVWAAGGGGS